MFYNAAVVFLLLLAFWLNLLLPISSYKTLQNLTVAFGYEKFGVQTMLFTNVWVCCVLKIVIHSCRLLPTAQNFLPSFFLLVLTKTTLHSQIFSMTTLVLYRFASFQPRRSFLYKQTARARKMRRWKRTAAILSSWLSGILFNTVIIFLFPCFITKSLDICSQTAPSQAVYSFATDLALAVTNFCSQLTLLYYVSKSVRMRKRRVAAAHSTFSRGSVRSVVTASIRLDTNFTSIPPVRKKITWLEGQQNFNKLLLSVFCLSLVNVTLVTVTFYSGSELCVRLWPFWDLGYAILLPSVFLLGLEDLRLNLKRLFRCAEEPLSAALSAASVNAQDPSAIRSFFAYVSPTPSPCASQIFNEQFTTRSPSPRLLSPERPMSQNYFLQPNGLISPLDVGSLYSSRQPSRNSSIQLTPDPSACKTARVHRIKAEVHNEDRVKGDDLSIVSC